MSDNQTEGTLELHDKGHGFLRSAKRNYNVHPMDPFVSRRLVERYALRPGADIMGTMQRSSGRGAKFDLVEIEKINGSSPAEYMDFQPFKELTVVDPCEPIRFGTKGGPLSMRVVDLMTPIGMGQRGLIAAPPRTGKTVLLQQMAAGLAANHPDMYMMVLLIDERPEEVTEMRRTVHGEVVSSSNDENVASHVRIARLMIEKAKRMVEAGEHVLILLDSLTRLGRAFNASVKSSGRTMSGGLDSRALSEPKSIFGSARNIENGGSLTILATALIETGSRMDELIFNEFKGTGNMEIMLTRELANQRLWPAMDLNMSGTRKEELLLGHETVDKISKIRRQISHLPPTKAMETLLDSLGEYSSNEEFIKNLA
jgi:transcription termination factor Rho